MKKTIFPAVILVAVVGASLFLISRKAPFFSENKQTVNSGNFASLRGNQSEVIENKIPETSDSQNENSTDGGFQAPITRAGERITKKKFGIYVTPENSPVSPERFRGYHTGADFEIFPEELEAEVPIRAICSGKLKLKESLSGYGGMAVEECELRGAPIAVIYGHLKLASIGATVGENMRAGDVIGVLGADKSVETGGERKHLHLGFHQGSTINIRGYVQDPAALSRWIDPCLYVCGQ